MKSFLLILAVMFCFSAKNGLVKERSLLITESNIEADNLGYYFTHSSTQIDKYDILGNHQNRYNSQTIGEISTIDVSDPLRILVFFKDISAIQFLDNRLSEHGQIISLLDLNMEQAEIVSKSFNNQILIYDSKGDRLLKVDEALKINFEIPNIQNIIGHKANFTQIVERGQFIYINNPKYGIEVFDNFGGYSNTIPLKSIEKFDVINGKIIYLKNNKIHSYHSKTLDEASYSVMDSISDFSVNKKNLFLLHSDSLHIFKLMQ